MSGAESDSSGLSSAGEEEIQKLAPIFVNAKKATKKRYPPPHVSPPRPKRPPSPPREDQFADNPDIAVIAMFRSRFNEAFPTKLAHFGPQDIERGVTDQPPSPQVESLLCALLGLVLNRKKPVERGHHGRALEEAVSTMKPQWPHYWNGVNPLHGPRDFNTMPPSDRLNLLRTLIHWSLTSSEAIQTILKDRYKQQRHADDENQPLSVQPWGSDGDKRRYFLVQGLDDTDFRVYRESSRYTKNASWINVAGGIEELKALGTKLSDVDGSQMARRLAGRIQNAIPTFEASEEKRRRREYRQIKRAAFSRPEPGFSLYEGRTRGKRLRYTYDDDDDDEDGAVGGDSDATSTRRSTRNQSSARNTPFEAVPTYTASGRQVHKPRTGEYGEPLLKAALENATEELAQEEVDGAAGTDGDSEVVGNGRAKRAAGRRTEDVRKRKRVVYDDEDEDEAAEMSEEDEEAGADGWDSDRNAEDDTEMPDADDESEIEDGDAEPQSLVIKLKLSRGHAAMKGEGTTAEESTNNTATEARRNSLHEPPQHSAQQPNGLPTQTLAGADPNTASTHLPNGYASANMTNSTTTNAANQSLETSTPSPATSAYPTPASISFPSMEAAQKPPAVPAASVTELENKDGLVQGNGLLGAEAAVDGAGI